MCNYEENYIYNSDTGRIIRKFDIYVCDLGTPTGISGDVVGKTRPCVILSSDNINDPIQCYYKVAPIRTEHAMEVTRETVEDIVKEREKTGQFYVPIEMEPGDFRFIDMSQTMHISSRKITRYNSSILNEKTKRRINNVLAHIFFTKEELEDVMTSFENHKREKVRCKREKAEIVKDLPVVEDNFEEELTEPEGPMFYPTETVKEEKIEARVEFMDTEIGKKIQVAISPELEFSDTFVQLYPSVKRGSVSAKSAAARLRMTETKFKSLMKKYEDHIASIEPKETKQEENKPEENNIVVSKPIDAILNKQTKGRKTALPTGFSIYYQKYKSGKMTQTAIAKKLGKSQPTINKYIKLYEEMQAEF